MKRVAIIGSGISGLGCAYFLHREFEISVFEAENRVGGHSHTVTVNEAGYPIPIDTGFMVFNRITYPTLVRLFETLDVPVKPTDMSFSVHCGPRGLEYCGSSLNHLFAQRRNLLRPSFYRLLLTIDRFNREAIAALADPALTQLSLADYVRHHGYSEDFLHLYLIPMSSAVWSTPPEKMLRFPAASLLRFFHNHGFLGLHTQHPWWTVDGGSKVYVDLLTAPFRDRIQRGRPVQRIRRREGYVEVITEAETERFDKAILACHAPAALELLGTDATAAEHHALSVFRYQPNTTILHTDRSVMPLTRRAWSSWNYRLDANAGAGGRSGKTDSTALRASTHYWMNRLQGLPPAVDYFVSLNAESLIDPAKILRWIEYEHPLFDREAVATQAILPGLNALARGGRETYFAGAWQRHGFHEDGLLSALQTCTLLLGRDPWNASERVNVELAVQ